MLKYCLYARKSTEEEDRQVLSIDSQINELKEIAKKKNLQITDILVEAKSAKAPGRPVFNEMITKINNGVYDGILCWKLDRLARNPVDGGQISWLLQQGVIKSIQAFEKEYLPTDNVLLMSVELGMANQFIRDLSTNTLRGLKTKADNGWYPTVAPIGYLNDKLEKTIIKDHERFDLIKKAWELMLSGLYSPADIWKISISDWHLTTLKRRRSGGRPLHKCTFYHIFTNPFYYGWFEYNGRLYKGLHEPMISEDEFWRVQALLGTKGRKRAQNHQFAYTGMIRCGECGGMITAEEKNNRNKTNSKVRHYIYYRCTKKNPKIKCSQSYVQSVDLEKQIDKFLESISIPKDFLDWALKYLKEAHNEEADNQIQIKQSLQKADTNIQKQLNTLIDMRIRELIDDSEYLERKEKLLIEQGKIKEKLEDADEASKNWLELTEKTFEFSHHARYWFNHGSLEDKKLILQTIGSNFVLKDKKLHIEPVKLFSIVAEGSKNKNWLPESDSNGRPTRYTYLLIT